MGLDGLAIESSHCYLMNKSVALEYMYSCNYSCPSIHLFLAYLTILSFIHPPIRSVSIHPYAHPCTQPSTHPCKQPTLPLTHLSIHPFTNLPTYPCTLPNHASIYLPIPLPTHPSTTHPRIHLPSIPSTHPPTLYIHHSQYFPPRHSLPASCLPKW